VTKFLILRFSSIGDIILTTAVIRCLKQQYPDAIVHFITKESYHALLKENPFIDKIYTIREDIGEVLAALKQENYDYLIDLHKNLRSFQLIFSLRKPYHSFPKLNLQKFLICSLKINILPDIHIVDRYFKAVEKLGIKNDGKGLDYYIPTETNPWEKIPGLPEKEYIALVIGGKHATKQLPPEKLLELCRQLTKPVVILGGPEDKATGEWLIDQLRSPQGIVHSPWSIVHSQRTIDPGQLQTKSESSSMDYGLSTIDYFSTCGLLSLNESAALLRDADYVITHDTGLMHIAAALKKNIVSIWGNTIPAFGMYPYLPKDFSGYSKILEVKGLSCRPCSKLGYQKCPKGHFKCMKDVDVLMC